MYNFFREYVTWRVKEYLTIVSIGAKKGELSVCWLPVDMVID